MSYSIEMSGLTFVHYRTINEAAADFPNIYMWMSIKEWAAYHGVKYCTARRWLSDGRFPDAIWIDGHPRIPPECGIPQFARSHRSREFYT